MKTSPRIQILSLAILAAAALPVRAQSLSEAGRNLLRRHERSLWTVDVQLRQTLSMAERSGTQEGKVSTLGTLVDVGNLILIPLLALEPSNLMRATNPQARNLQIQSEVVEVKVQLPEGGEVPATVVYRDNDLDLAFLAPKEPLPKDAVPIRLGDAGKPSVLDTAIMLSRYTGMGRRVVVVNAGYIQAVLEKPQPGYFYEHANLNTAGCPVFMPDGKLVGVVLARFMTTPQADGSSNVSAVGMLVSAETLREAAEQANAARKKSAAPAPAPAK